jgi:hypothetical protein
MYSDGPCEICGKRAHCYDVPSKYLPQPKKKELWVALKAANQERVSSVDVKRSMRYRRTTTLTTLVSSRTAGIRCTARGVTRNEVRCDDRVAVEAASASPFR